MESPNDGKWRLSRGERKRESLFGHERTNQHQEGRKDTLIIWLRFAIKLRTNVFASCVNNGSGLFDSSPRTGCASRRRRQAGVP